MTPVGDEPPSSTTRDDAGYTVLPPAALSAALESALRSDASASSWSPLSQTPAGPEPASVKPSPEAMEVSWVLNQCGELMDIVKAILTQARHPSYSLPTHPPTNPPSLCN